jgi:hypothetical protein
MLISGLSALNVGSVLSSHEVFLSVELKPSFPDDSTRSPDYPQLLNTIGIVPSIPITSLPVITLMFNASNALCFVEKDRLPRL